MTVRLISTPLTQVEKLSVVNIEEMKAHARVIGDYDDDQIAGMLASAHDVLAHPVYGWLRRMVLLPQTFEALASGVPQAGCGGVELLMRPFLSIESIERLEGNTFVDCSDMVEVVYDEPFYRIERVGLWGYYPPKARSFRVRFQAGYGDPTLIPEPIKLSIKMLVGHWYNNRETVGAEGRTIGKELEYGLKKLCGMYRLAQNPS